MGISGTEDTQMAGLAGTLAGFSEIAANDGEPLDAWPTAQTRYETAAVLGRGGMGVVYVARDAQFGRDVALKEMAGESFPAEAVRRFGVEALVTGNLEHPGIPAVYERGVRDGKPFYAMRKVDGRTLATAIREARSFEDRLALLPTLVQVAHTLGFAHERGVVHRDVKPDNVVLGDHGETILLDWGIARVRGVTFAPSVGGVAPDAHATSAGAVMGTPAYMAPEQAAGRVDEIDERTDVFALGAMLYHVLSGAPPYTGPTSAAVLARAIGAEHTPIDRAAPKVARELHALINTAMAKERTERYPNASAFADALQEFLNSRVRDRSSPIVRTLGTAIGLGIVAAVILFAIMLADTISSIGEQGFAAYAYIVLTTLGVCLGVIDWITKGRNHLAPLVLACAGTTMLTGFAGLFAGIGIVVRAAARVPPDETMPVLLEGMWEVSGNIPFAAAAAGVQLVLWALVRRARLLAVQDGD